MAKDSTAPRGWSDPDTRTAGVIVIGSVLALLVIGVVFRDVNAA
jgi:hypothetical protein